MIIKKKMTTKASVGVGKREYSLLVGFQTAPATVEMSVKYSGISLVS